MIDSRLAVRASEPIYSDFFVDAADEVPSKVRAVQSLCGWISIELVDHEFIEIARIITSSKSEEWLSAVSRKPIYASEY